MVNQFSFSSLPRIVFGPGKIEELSALSGGFGDRILILTGQTSFKGNKKVVKQFSELELSGKNVKRSIIEKEPTVKIIDSIVAARKGIGTDLVIAIGGGSVMDAGKAVSAMLTVEGSIAEYLEGSSALKIHPGTKVPFIAVPTTAGTGSETTKNAVISEVGSSGFKRSLRHDRFTPDIALIDPELTLTCPKKVTAISGMDAFTQLLESYLSVRANPLTDALAISGLEHISLYLERAYDNGTDPEARSGMAYAALCSGITLANAGLGTVHGFASSVGGHFDIPHGAICGTMMAVVNEYTISKLRMLKNNADALEKFQRVGQIFHKSDNRAPDFYIDFLVGELYRITDKLKIPKLSRLGFDENEIITIAKKTSCKNNPVQQTENELAEMLEKRM
jgi:alcohol dehydrogenase class IV